MQVAIFGLGRMGGQIARRLHTAGFDVVAWNRSEGPREEFKQFGGKVGDTVEATVAQLGESPRVFWVMLPNDTTEEFIFGPSSSPSVGGVRGGGKEGLIQYLQPGDIVIDGGNSFYKDSMRRAEKLQERGVHFFDCGTSGGVWGEQRGFAIMVGGEKEVWPQVEPIFKTLSSGDNYGLVGKNGAGHFVKMVHNGIEYGMMQAIGEGYGVMHASGFDLDLAKVTQIYQQGSVISSWLIDLTRTIFEHEDIAGTKGVIAATGEGEWTIQAAKELGVSVPVIEDSFRVRQESNDPKNQELFSNKIVALLRKQFGGHGVESKGIDKSDKN